MAIYHVKGETIGTGGEATLEFNLLVNTVSGLASGHAEVKHALPAPPHDIGIAVTGTVHKLGADPALQVVTLQGTYLYSYPPPIILTILEHFNAVLLLNDEWHGHGSFTYGGHTVSNERVKRI
jgi:Domain of unknown function (DUF1842)